VFLIDTNVLSEIRKFASGKADSNVVAWAQSVDSSELFLSSISIMELEAGILLAARKDKNKAAILKHWLHEYVIPEFGERILPFGLMESLCCASLHVPDRRSERDAMICATAIVHKMCIVTRNIADFPPGRVTLLNPWNPPL